MWQMYHLWFFLLFRNLGSVFLEGNIAFHFICQQVWYSHSAYFVQLFLYQFANNRPISEFCLSSVTCGDTLMKVDATDSVGFLVKSISNFYVVAPILPTKRVLNPSSAKVLLFWMWFSTEFILLDCENLLKKFLVLNPEKRAPLEVLIP